jgi:hypothetical protein
VKTNQSPLSTLPEIYRIGIRKLSDESLQTILEDREKALKYAKKGIMQVEPENIIDKYILLIADSMQVLARIELKERGILMK